MFNARGETEREREAKNDNNAITHLAYGIPIHVWSRCGQKNTFPNQQGLFLLGFAIIAHDIIPSISGNAGIPIHAQQLLATLRTNSLSEQVSSARPINPWLADAHRDTLYINSSELPVFAGDKWVE